jgi:hypothetical protein
LAAAARAGLGLLHRRWLVVTQAALQGHLITHVPQVKIQGPLDLVVLKGLAGSLQRVKALTDQPGWGALLPLQGVFKGQTIAPLPLLGEVTVMVRAVDPEQTTGLVHEVTIMSLRDPRHLEVLH